MLESIITARKADIGGLEVGRLLPSRERRMVGPFTFLDHGGPIDLPAFIPDTLDVLPHPHIGLSTVTYLLDGTMTHRDSLGVEQVIRPGDVNWMTAGRGISHSERFEGPFKDKGGAFNLLQAWVALPVEHEEADPSFNHHPSQELPIFEEGGLWARLIAGTAFGVSAPVKTHSPLFYMHVQLQAGAKAAVPGDHPERAVYVVKGCVEVAGHAYRPGEMLVFAPGAAPLITAQEASTVMMLGGEPVGPRHIWWNFVSSRKERIEQAKADWQAGRIALPPHDARAFVPLP
ncbi:pirin family protein [bacterium]|nr:pirin family protein [bacterium]